MNKHWYKVGYKFKGQLNYIKVEESELTEIVLESELTEVVLEFSEYSLKILITHKEESNDKEGA